MAQRLHGRRASIIMACFVCLTFAPPNTHPTHRQMYAHARLAAAAHEKELLEAKARVAVERQLAAAQQQAAQRALSVAREKAANEAKSEFMSLMWVIMLLAWEGFFKLLHDCASTNCVISSLVDLNPTIQPTPKTGATRCAPLSTDAWRAPRCCSRHPFRRSSVSSPKPSVSAAPSSCQR